MTRWSESTTSTCTTIPRSSGHASLSSSVSPDSDSSSSTSRIARRWRDLFESEGFDRVLHLAAQAGVRYSLENPFAYVDSNLVGFAAILEGCRRHSVQHLVYASSSSVYGINSQMPFSVHHSVDHPISLYAATKKANELMAHAYSHLYRLPTTGLRFFTVYGPWGRPDMALFLFTRAILRGEPIKIFNNGRMRRDFTYVDDIVEGVVRVLDCAPQGNPDWDGAAPDPASSPAPYRIFNIGNQKPGRADGADRVAGAGPRPDRDQGAPASSAW